MLRMRLDDLELFTMAGITLERKGGRMLIRRRNSAAEIGSSMTNGMALKETTPADPYDETGHG